MFDFFNKIGDFITAIVNTIKQAFESVVDGVATVKDGFNLLISFVSFLPSEITVIIGVAVALILAFIIVDILRDIF